MSNPLNHLGVNEMTPDSQQASPLQTQNTFSVLKAVGIVATASLAILGGAFALYLGASLMGAPILLAVPLQTKIIAFSITFFYATICAASCSLLSGTRDLASWFTNPNLAQRIADVERQLEHLEQHVRQ